MNYIRHLNTFFSHVKTDNRLTSSHVSLYMALFQYWNFNRFNNPFSIYRDNIMQLSKLSKNTYHKCVKELHEAKYIYYHPSASKFQAVRISIIRMDREEEPTSKYQQLDLFTIAPGFSPQVKIETDSVPNSIPHSPNIKTDTVTDLRHNIKPNNKQERETSPTHQIFKKNKKIQNAINDFIAPVPNMGHTVDVTLNEVEAYFQQNNYPSEEATKFYNHYKALGWKIQGKTPIEDWKALVEKWMTNAVRWNPPLSKGGAPTASGRGISSNDLKYLYETFLEGKKIFHHITVAHFEQLKLKLTDETIQQARHERINQVAGTNQHSLTQIWQAYLTNNPHNPIIQKDKPNLITLAKRIAVIKHFHSLKQSNIKTLPP